MAKVGALIAAVVVVVGAVRSWPPLLTAQRGVIASSPGVEPLFSRDDVKLIAGQRLCVAPVVLTPQTARIRMKVVAERGPARGLRLRATARNYQVERPVLTVQPGALQPIAADIRAPGQTLTGRVCLLNGGPRPISVLGTNEVPSLTNAQTTVNGRPVEGQDITLLLLEARPRSLVSRLPTVFDRASQMTGGLMPVWLLWPVLLLMLFGVPAAACAALWSSVRSR
jgi:hypothetical protein